MTVLFDASSRAARTRDAAVRRRQLAKRVRAVNDRLVRLHGANVAWPHDPDSRNDAGRALACSPPVRARVRLCQHPYFIPQCASDWPLQRVDNGVPVGQRRPILSACADRPKRGVSSVSIPHQGKAGRGKRRSWRIQSGNCRLSVASPRIAHSERRPTKHPSAAASILACNMMARRRSLQRRP